MYHPPLLVLPQSDMSADQETDQETDQQSRPQLHMSAVYIRLEEAVRSTLVRHAYILFDWVSQTSSSNSNG